MIDFPPSVFSVELQGSCLRMKMSKSGDEVNDDETEAEDELSELSEALCTLA
jgi:hypothetical protein